MSSVRTNLPGDISSKSDSADASQLMLVEIMGDSEGSDFRFMEASELTELTTSKHRILYHADMDAGSLTRLHPRRETIELPDVGARAFLEGIKTALNAMEIPTDQKEVASKLESETSRIRSLSSYAMDAATDAFFDFMEQNIDRWTYDASSSMLSLLAMQKSTDITAQRREAADIQVKSKAFNTEFRAFFIENLVSFKSDEPAQSDATRPALALVSSDLWKSHNIEPLLAREYEGQTKIEFSQLNRRLGVILDRSLSADENVLGPKAIARTVSQALNECGYSKKQREVLEPIIIADFNTALEKLYRQINQIWIALDILPEVKLEILNTSAA